VPVLYYMMNARKDQAQHSSREEEEEEVRHDS
jgi:hypothetical protein